MDPARWPTIERIFLEAVKLPPDDRQAYLNNACTGDASLRAEVSSLLSADAERDGLLSGSALDAIDTGDLLSHFENHLDSNNGRGNTMSQRCERGHFYDSSKHVSCPHCGVPGLDIDPGKTQPVAGSQPSAARSGVDEKTHGRKIVEEGATVGVFKSKIGIEPVVGWLVCTDGPDRGRDYRIRSQRNFIGRDSRMDISISSDDQISRENHAALTYDPRSNSFRLSPGEAHGLTYLNNEAVDVPVTLKPYDRIELGKTSLVFVPFCSEAFQWQ